MSTSTLSPDGVIPSQPSKEDPGTDKETKKSRKFSFHINEYAAICLIGVLIVASVMFYVDHQFFFENTKLNGLNVSSRSIKEAGAILNEQSLDELKITISGRNSDPIVISGTDIGWGYTREIITGAISSSRKGRNRFSADKLSYEGTVYPWYDEKALSAFLNRGCGVFLGSDMPKDAYLGRGEDNGFIIVPADKGNTLVNRADTIKYVEEQIKNEVAAGRIEFTVSIPDSHYVNPEKDETDADLNQVLEKLNEIAYRGISIDIFDGEVNMCLKDIASISIDGRYEISDEKIKEFVSYLKAEYDTIGKDRTIRLPNGKKYTVHGTPEDTYGFELNEEETYELLKKAVEKGYEETYASYYRGGLVRNGNGYDIGEDYIFVDIDNQKLTAVKEGKIFLESDFVSGLETDPDRATPGGVYCIWQKDTATYLTGQEDDGSEYNTYVNYWMALDFRGVGLHDALWRDKFGKTIYKVDGSHGCVNLPIDVAQTLYYNYEEGTPVLIYRADKTAEEEKTEEKGTQHPPAPNTTGTGSQGTTDELHP